MLSHAEPELTGSERAKHARAARELATDVSRERPHAQTRSNDEESDHYPQVPANFTKGLAHDEHGVVAQGRDYAAFVRAINSHDPHLFDSDVETAGSRGLTPAVQVRPGGTGAPVAVTGTRGWESPRSGHCYDLEGPDAGSVGMAPAPRLGSSELAAEVAEVYGMALVRDVPFTSFDDPGATTIDGATPQLTPAELAPLFDGMPFYSGAGRRSSQPHLGNGVGLDRFERNRRAARTGDDVDGVLGVGQLFRGSTAGAGVGPYVSQFLLAGNASLPPVGASVPSYPGVASRFAGEDGYVRYGTQVVDQRVVVARHGLDYMTDWQSWLDVQNGWDLRGLDQFEGDRRFITTPRDLATYVHYDALYQAYLNACLLLWSSGTRTSKGFPEPNLSGTRDAFATFGGPHVLSLVTEIATRCLKAVRRQKFNHHRRARPEVVAARLALAASLDPAALPKHPLGSASRDVEAMLAELPTELTDAVVAHNAGQNDPTVADDRWVVSDPTAVPAGFVDFDDRNLLLPMAFPEGSPMHPAYGAGHATVAGGCVTVLKAFFEMFDRNGPGGRRVLQLGDADYLVPDDDGTELVNVTDQPLTVEGELDKLAANISIGRNMAGVHYYSDYYDSLRMGERVAVGMLMEQSTLYGDMVETTFTSFDGDNVTIAGEPGSHPNLTVRDRTGEAVEARDWWLRHSWGETGDV